MLKPAVILLVDDDADCRALIGDAVSSAGIPCRAFEAADGTAALDFVRRRGPYADAPRPDLILLDLKMPGLKGQEVLTRIKSDPELRDIPVVILSGSDTGEESLLASHNGANSHIVKPVNAGKFTDVVTRATEYWLGVHRRSPAGAAR